MPKTPIAAVIAALLAAGGCSYQVQAPDEPIEISLEWQVRHEVSVLVPSGDGPKAAGRHG
jgi:hypothetical protein